MKELGKKLNQTRHSIEAYVIPCQCSTCACSCSCSCAYTVNDYSIYNYTSSTNQSTGSGRANEASFYG